jgi:flagellar assembly protein FliH
MSFSGGYGGVLSLPFAALQYRDIAGEALSLELQEAGSNFPPQKGGGKRRAEVEMTEAELAERIRQERTDAATQTEQRLRQEFEQKVLQARAPVANAIKEFATQRDEYFGRVESEIVQLSLSIAAKILHRESQLDPMLVATLVRLALEKMREGSNVTIRVGAGRGSSWSQYFAAFPNLGHIEVVEDAQLSSQDCLVETELGSANFGLDTQLKEVEQGFFDLLALRPANR